MKEIILVIVCLAGLAVGNIQEDKKTIKFYNDSRKTTERDTVAVESVSGGAGYVKQPSAGGGEILP